MNILHIYSMTVYVTSVHNSIPVYSKVSSLLGTLILVASWYMSRTFTFFLYVKKGDFHCWLLLRYICHFNLFCVFCDPCKEECLFLKSGFIPWVFLFSLSVIYTHSHTHKKRHRAPKS